MNSESIFKNESTCNSTHFYHHEPSHCEYQNLNYTNEHCLRMNDIENIHTPCQDCCDRSNNLWIHEECHGHCDNHSCIRDHPENCRCNMNVHKVVHQQVEKQFNVECTDLRDNSATTTDINSSSKCEKSHQSTKYEDLDEPFNSPCENSEKTQNKVSKKSSDTTHECPVFGVFITTHVKKLKQEDKHDYKEECEEIDSKIIDDFRSDKVTKKGSHTFRRFRKEGRSKERRKRSTSSVYRAEEFKQPRVLFKQSSSEYNGQSYNRASSDPRHKDYANLENVPSRHQEGCCCSCGRKPYVSGTSIASSPRDSGIMYAENEAFCIPYGKKGRPNPRQFDSFKLPSDMNVSRDLTGRPDEYSSRGMSSECFKDRNTRRHSTCNFCSRKCTPSKASLFVETSGSAARFHYSGSTTETEHLSNTSVGSIITGKERKVYKKRTEKSSSQTKFKDYKMTDKSDSLSRKCSPDCRGRPGFVGHSYSDEFPARERYYERDRALHRKQEEIQGKASSTDYVWRRKIRTKDACSNTTMYSKDGRECKTQTESVIEINAKTTHSGTCQRSLWSGIQKGKIWTQMQDAYKNVVKIVATNVNQILKDPNKGKNSRKNSKELNLHCDNPCTEFTKKTGENLRDNCQGIFKCKTPSVCDVYNRSCCQPVHCPSKQNANITDTPECVYSTSERNIRRNRGGSDRNSSFPKQKRQHAQQSNQRGYNARNEYNNGIHNTYNDRYQIGREESLASQEVYNDEESSIDDRILNPTQYLETKQMKAFANTNVQAGVSRSGAEPLSASHQQEEVECGGVSDNEGNSRRCDRNATCTSKWVASSVEDVDSMVQALSTKQRRMRHETQPPSPRKLESRYLNSERPGSKMTNNNNNHKDNNRSKTYEVRKGNVSPNGKHLPKSPVKDPKNQKNVSPSPIKNCKRCHTIRRYQIVCVDHPSKKISDVQETMCLCDQSKFMMSKSKFSSETPSPDIFESTRFEDASTQPEVSMRSNIVDDKSMKSVVEEPKEAQVVDAPTKIADNEESYLTTDATTGETANLEDTTYAEPAEDQAEDAGQKVVTSKPDQEDATSIPVQEDLSKKQEPIAEEGTKSEVKKEQEEKADATFDIIEEPPIASSTLKEETAPKADIPPNEPIEYVREHNGGRTRVNVQMQTSNTILTKILSEFEVGNKKKRIVMSIKLHTESDNCVAEGAQDAPEEMQSQRSAVYIASSVSKLWTASYEYLSKVDTLNERIPQIDSQTERKDTEYRECLEMPCLRTNDVRNNYDPRHRRVKPDKPSAFNSLNARNHNRDIRPSNNNVQGNNTIPFTSRRRPCCVANTSTSTNEGTIYPRHLGSLNGSAGPCAQRRTCRRLT